VLSWGLMAEKPMAGVLNPFEPPKEDEEKQSPKRPRRQRAGEHYLVDARPRARFTNYALDSAVSAMVIGAMGTADGSFVASYLVYFAYYCGFEAFTGKSPAKWLTRTRVITNRGTRPTLGVVFKRTLVRMIPFEPLSYLGRGRGWHDRWTETRVVYEDEASARRGG